MPEPEQYGRGEHGPPVVPDRGDDRNEHEHQRDGAERNRAERAHGRGAPRAEVGSREAEVGERER